MTGQRASFLLQLWDEHIATGGFKLSRCMMFWR
jgi:hypothetical protein